MSLSDPDFLTSNITARNTEERQTLRLGISTKLRLESQPALQTLHARSSALLAAQVLTFPKSIAVSGDVAVDAPASAPQAYRDGLKRIFDIVMVLASAVIWAPFVLLAAVMIAVRDGHSPFYTQDRVGRGGQVFRMLKLRSMVPDADAKLEAYLASDPAARHEWNTTQKLKRDPRITTLGRIIRKTSLDELPQLVNVLNGDMSIVGPRPFMVNQREMYHGHRYYDLRPGLTGFWQISDRNECNFAQRAHFDTAYYRAVSLKTDLTVIFRTVGVILRGTGY